MATPGYGSRGQPVKNASFPAIQFIGLFPQRIRSKLPEGCLDTFPRGGIVRDRPRSRARAR